LEYGPQTNGLDRAGYQVIEILRTVVGSGLHGIAIDGQDDRDEMGIFIEPPEVVLGLAPTHDHDEKRTQPQGVRSGPGDTDLIRYSLRKYLRLAVQGNPTILLPLYAPENAVLIGTDTGDGLREMKKWIVSQQVIPRFMGYMHAQRMKMQGIGKVPNRPELIEKYGYDVKFASHALRLAIQGFELLNEGTIHLPMKPEHIELIRAIKLGQVSKEDVLKEIESWESLMAAYATTNLSRLRKKPRLDFINEWSIRAHLAAWELV
jgi:predicted nucleotidyltransferase